MNYFYKGMKLPPYIPLPKFLLQTELSLNAQMVYALLLGRSNISASEKNFDGTVTDLEMKHYLCVRDFRWRKNKKGEAYGWAIAVYATPEHIFG